MRFFCFFLFHVVWLFDSNQFHWLMRISPPPLSMPVALMRSCDMRTMDIWVVFSLLH